MHRCTHSAAGGTIHRLKPGLATVCSRSRNDNKAMVQILPSNSPIFCVVLSADQRKLIRVRMRKQKMRLPFYQAGKRNRFIAIGNRWFVQWPRGGYAAGNNPPGARARASSISEATPG